MPCDLEEDLESCLSESEERRLSSLFNRLDVNHDGLIDVNDLSKALQKFHIPQLCGQAQVTLF
jgi:Ca2+-binding EF-hand superfamily protein